jgi:hypothetical protein
MLNAAPVSDVVSAANVKLEVFHDDSGCLRRHHFTQKYYTGECVDVMGHIRGKKLAQNNSKPLKASIRLALMHCYIDEGILMLIKC